MRKKIIFFITTKHSVSASLNFITKWGYYDAYSGGTANGKFTAPWGVAKDTSGDIYVVDAGNNRVEKFDSTGAYVMQWGSYGNGVGQFNNPRGITTVVLSGTTYVYVSDSNGVEKFQTDGTPVLHFGSGGGYGNPGGAFYSPQGIAVDSTGKLYVTDSGNQYVQEFDPDGTYNTSISGFSGPNGIAVDLADNVYVADTNHNQVKEFDSGGASVTQWSTVNYPYNIAVDTSSGDVYITSGYNNGVERYNSNGTTLLKQWGSAGSQDGQFSNAQGIVVDSSGNVYVSDADNNRVEKFDNNGNYLSKLGYFLPADGAFNTPQGVAADSSGNVYVADTLNDRIQKFDNAGTYLAQWGTPGTNDGAFASPYALAINFSTGNIYVADTGNNRIEEFDSGGTFVRKWGSLGGLNGQFNGPKGITVDSSGNVYVADTGNNRIQKFDANGIFNTQWGGAGSTAGHFSGPIGIVVDSAGNVYVSDAGNNRVQRFDNLGNYISQWGGFSSITGIGVDPTGNVYVADSGNDKIQKFSSSGVFISYVGSSGTGNGQFNAPSGVAFDQSGNLFVIDTNNNRVQKFSVNLDLGLYFSNADTNFYRGTGTVDSLLKAGNTLYIGGVFGLQAVDITTGQAITWSPDLPSGGGGTPQVFALAYSAANNILYVGSDNGLLEYDISTSTGTLVTDFAPVFAQSGGGFPTVYALTIVNNTLYVGGSFTSIDANPRVNLASYDISTSTAVLTNWEQDTDTTGTVYAFTASNTQLFAGGQFSTVASVSQPSIAAFDLTTGNLVNSFASGFVNTDTIQALAFDSNKVYTGGTFTSVNGAAFNNLVSLDEATGGAILTWVPITQNPVKALSIGKSYLYVAEGNSGGTGGFAHGYNLQTGNAIDWYPQSSQPVLAILATDPSLYVGLSPNQYSTDGDRTNLNKTLAVKDNKNMFDFIPVAQAAGIDSVNRNLLVDIGGLTGTIYLAKFDSIPALVPSVTPTIVPTQASGQNPSAPVCSNQKPGIPSNPSVIAGPGAGQATLSWTAPTGPVTDYSIVYSNDLNVKKWGVVSTGNVTTYTISNLPGNQNYYFWINAVNGCMPGDPINPQIELLVTGTGSASGVAGTGNGAFIATQTANSTSPLSPLPATGPADTIKLGIVGAIITLIGGALLLVL
jgi:DNA-binding beta-propeller fold protein YncE